MAEKYSFYGWEGAKVPPVNEKYKKVESPQKLYDILSELWCADTCAPRMRGDWTKENKTLGQCSITAFLAQDIFGGKVCGIERPGGNFHCYNVVGDCVFDLTSEQFGRELLDYTDNPEQFREVHFAKEEKYQRYLMLKASLERYITEGLMTENIRVYKQNSIRIDAGDSVIYADPFQMEEAPHDATFILITHDHYDHFDPESVKKVSTGKTVLVVPEKMEKKAGEVASSVGRIVTVKPGASENVDGLELETVPAYNILKPFHPKGAGWVGYILNVCGKRIYIAGDTDATKEAKAVKCDIALVPVGGTYTMDAAKAAELVNTIKPEVAIPVHYGSVVGSVKDGETFAAAVEPGIRVELKL